MITPYLVTNVGGQTQLTPQGNLRLKGTRVAHASRDAHGGSTYVLVLGSARIGGNSDVDRRPFIGSGGVTDYADTVIGQISP